MIIVRLIGGLGNQLFQYAIGKQLAIKNSVPLKLDLSVYDSPACTRSYKLNHFNVDCQIASPTDIRKVLQIYESKSAYAILFKKAERLLPKHKRRHYIEDEKLYYLYKPELMKVSSNVLLEGFWQHYRYYDDINPQVVSELTLKENHVEESYSLLTKIQQSPASVSLHIRRGDYVSDKNNLQYFGALPAEYYQKAIKLINSKIQNPSYYIFSDDLNWALENLPIHHENFTLVDICNGNRDYLELDLMSHCSHNIIANSSFSWWGAFLNKNPDKIVVSPANWLAVESINKNIGIHFPSWIKL